MPAPLPPAEISKALQRIIVNAKELDPAYRWGHTLGYFRRRGEPMEAVRGSSDPTRGGITQSIVNNDTLNFQRTLMTKASTSIMEAHKALELAISAVAAAYRSANDEHRVAAEPLMGDQIRRAELAVAQRAQARRQRRGEGWGEG